jgi:hypothetical protein
MNRDLPGDGRLPLGATTRQFDEYCGDYCRCPDCERLLPVGEIGVEGACAWCGDAESAESDHSVP